MRNSNLWPYSTPFAPKVMVYLTFDNAERRLRAERVDDRTIRQLFCDINRGVLDLR